MKKKLKKAQIGKVIKDAAKAYVKNSVDAAVLMRDEMAKDIKQGAKNVSEFFKKNASNLGTSKTVSAGKKETNTGRKININTKPAPKSPTSNVNRASKGGSTRKKK